MLEQPGARSIALEGTDEIDVWLPSARTECLSITALLKRTWLTIGEPALDNTVALTQRVRFHVKFLEALLPRSSLDTTTVRYFLDRLPNAPGVEIVLRNVAILLIFLDLIKKLLHQPLGRVLGRCGNVLRRDHPLEVRHPLRQWASGTISDSHTTALVPDRPLHLIDLISVRLRRVRAGDSILRASHDFDSRTCSPHRLRLLRLVTDERQNNVKTPASLLVALVAPVLDVPVAAIALCLRRPEGQGLAACLVSTVEEMQTGDDERLGPTTIGECQRCRRTLEVEIG